MHKIIIVQLINPMCANDEITCIEKASQKWLALKEHNINPNRENVLYTLTL